MTGEFGEFSAAWTIDDEREMQHRLWKDANRQLENLQNQHLVAHDRSERISLGRKIAREKRRIQNAEECLREIEQMTREGG